MTRTIFLITSIAVTALAVAAPSALGQGQPVDPVKYFYANERATLTAPVIHDHGDATQAKAQSKLLLRSLPTEVVRDHGDATQAKAQSKLLLQSLPTEVVRDHGDATQAKIVAQRIMSPSAPPIVRDHGDAEQAKLVAQASTSVSDVDSTSGSELNWSQLAIGFGLGILLAAGLWFGMRVTNVRQPAH